MQLGVIFLITVVSFTYLGNISQLSTPEVVLWAVFFFLGMCLLNFVDCLYDMGLFWEVCLGIVMWGISGLAAHYLFPFVSSYAG